MDHFAIPQNWIELVGAIALAVNSVFTFMNNRQGLATRNMVRDVQGSVQEVKVLTNGNTEKLANVVQASQDHLATALIASIQGASNALGSSATEPTRATGNADA